MAGQNGLWFELGVRDNNVVKTLESLQRQSALVGEGFDAATRNLNTMIGAMYKIAEVRNKLTQSRDNSKILGVDTKRIDDAIRRLDEFKNKLNSLQMGGNAKSNKEVVGAALGTEFNVMIKSLQGLVREQNNYNAAAERGGRQNWTAQMRDKAAATKQAAAAAQQAARAEEELIRQMQRVSEAGKEQGRIFQEMRNWVMSYFSFYGAKNLLQSIIEVGGAFEVQHIALQNILGDISKANQMFGELKALAVESPKSFRELASDAKMLAAYSIPANELFDTTKRLADLSSGLGVSMDRLILAYGQVRAAAFLRGPELRQFTEAGVPMVDALAKKFTELRGTVVSAREVITKLIPSKEVSFEMVDEVLKDMTSEGGKFYNMQFVLADTLAGKWSNLRDAWEIMLSEIAEGRTTTGEFLKAGVQGVTNFIKGINKLLPLLKGLALGMATLNFGKRFLGYTATNTFLGYYDKQREMLRKNALAAQISGSRQLSAIEKEILITKGQITSKEIVLLAKSQALTNNDIRRLALQGKISNFGLRRLVVEKQITREQYLQIKNMGKWKRNFALVGMRFNSIFKGIGNFWSANKLNLGLLGGFSAIFALYSKITSASEKIKNVSEDVHKETVRKAQSLKEVQDSLPAGMDEKSIISNIEAIDVALREHAGNYGTIVKEAQKLETVEERYALLRAELDKVTEAYSRLADEKTRYLQASLIEDGGGMWSSFKNFFTGNWDSMDEDMEQYAEATAEFNKQAADAWSKNAVVYVKALEKIKKRYANFYKENLLDPTTGKEKSWADMARALASAPINIQQYWAENAPDGNYFNVLGSARRDEIQRRDEVLREARSKAKLIKNHFMSEYNLKNDDEYYDWVKNNQEVIASQIQEYANTIKGASKEALNDVKNEMAEYTMKVRWFVEVDTKLLVLSDEGRNAWKQLGGNDLNWKDPNAKVTINGKQYLPEEINKLMEGGYTEAKSRQAQKVQKAYYNWQNAIKGSNTAEKERLKNIYDDEDAVFHQFWDGDPLNMKKNGTEKGGNKTDKLLKEWKQRMSQVSKLYSMYQTFIKNNYSQAGAIDKVRNSGLTYAKMLPSDIVDEKGLKEWIKKSREEAIKTIKRTTEDRNTFIDDVISNIYNVDADELSKAIERLGERLMNAIREGSEKWDLYKSLRDSLGNESVASMLVYNKQGGGPKTSDVIRTNADKMRKHIQGTIPGAGNQSLDELYEIFRSGDKNLYPEYEKLWPYLEKLFEALKKETSEQVKLVEAALKSSLSEYENLMAKLSDAERQKEAVEKSDLSPVRKQQAKDRIDASISNERLKASTDYYAFFNAILTMTGSKVKEVADLIRDNLNEQLANNKISTNDYVDSLKKVKEQEDKFREGRSEISAWLSGGFQGLLDLRATKSRGDANVAVKEYNEAVNRREYARATASDLVKTSDLSDEEKTALDEAILSGNIEYLNGSVSTLNSTNHDLIQVLKELIGEEKRANVAEQNKNKKEVTAVGDENKAAKNKELSKAISGIKDKFDVLIKGPINNMMGMLSALGIDTSAGTVGGAVEEGADIASNALGAAAQGAAVAGPWGAAIAGGVSLLSGVIGGFAKQHDARLEKQIQLAEERNHIISNVKEILEKKFERILGGIYAMRLDTDTRKQLNDIKKDKGSYKYDTRSTANEALKSSSYYLGELALMKSQRDNARIQMNSESDKKKRDDVKISDYQKKIAELDDQIVHFAEDMAKTLYDIDLKSWASELGDALFEAWSKGENAMDAYKEKLQELIGKTAKNIITTRILEKAFDGPLKKLVQIMDASNGVLTETNIQPFLDSLMQATEMSIPALEGAYGVLEKWMNTKGMTLKETGSASGGNTIKGITEDQADIIIAYINGMRADLSMQIRVIKQLAESNVPNMQNTFELQLLQLRKIEANTNRSADNTDEIVSVLSSVVNGTKKFAVR